MYLEMAYNKKQIIRLKENLPKVKVNLPQTRTLTWTFSCYTEELWAGRGRGSGLSERVHRYLWAACQV